MKSGMGIRESLGYRTWGSMRERLAAYGFFVFFLVVRIGGKI